MHVPGRAAEVQHEAVLSPLSGRPSVETGRAHGAVLITWPVATFAGLLAGVLMSWGALWGALFLLVPLCGLSWRADTFGRSWSLMALALIACAFGAVRERQWSGAPSALAEWRGAVVTLDGEWDGQFLRLAEPGARVALSPKPQVPAGTLRVRGTLNEPGGKRNPGGFDYALWLRVQGVHEVVYGAQVLHAKHEGGVRGWFRRGLRSGLGAHEGALMEAIELGDRREIQQTELQGGLNTRDAFARAGLAHLMALSGQNVALLVGAATFLLARTPLKLWRYPLLLALLGAYLWLVGPSPSITRAVLMGGAVLLGLWVGRGKLEALGTLGLAGTVCLAVYPLWVFDLGFQLSFLAVLALTFTPRLEARLPARWPRPLKFALAGTILAELGTLPVIAHHFGQVPLVGLPANLLAAPLMAALVPLGFVAGLLGPFSTPVNLVVLPLAQLLLTLVGVFGRVPALPWGNLGPVGFVAYGVFAGAFVLWLHQRVRVRHLGLIMGLCVLGTGLPARLDPPREIVYLDVGQGDSSLVRLGKFTMLIDGGGTPRGDFDVGAGTVVPALRAMGIFRLDVALASHDARTRYIQLVMLRCGHQKDTTKDRGTAHDLASRR
ncbi:ComEC/Rec2 family competence protein [Deinococcus peraridilitoris]|uniref:ComEC/Rec2-related protein n=1 Tax=Deinococcus peraridilitoris (strain DSM 19664 / LMG 22246 / CIP 109416 / KR-200) TaxID=937777 RepID=L0A369_DEIPD|nr:ComEC/Rec2 family competence protein [Deinococcus peraridilitoris]AFZ67602.1 ComEC/Rec2-related protein [Deinococcus peraridilitoris DSM 19664]